MADKEPHSGANQETQSVQVHRKIWMEGWLIDMCRSGEKIVPQEEHRQGCVTACSPLNKCHREINKNASAVRISNKHARCLLSCTVCVFKNKASAKSSACMHVRMCHNKKQNIRTWFISSNFCLCCSFKKPKAFPPATEKPVIVTAKLGNIETERSASWCSIVMKPGEMHKASQLIFYFLFTLSIFIWRHPWIYL